MAGYEHSVFFLFIIYRDISLVLAVRFTYLISHRNHRFPLSVDKFWTGVTGGRPSSLFPSLFPSFILFFHSFFSHFSSWSVVSLWYKEGVACTIETCNTYNRPCLSAVMHNRRCQCAAMHNRLGQMCILHNSKSAYCTIPKVHIAQLQFWGRDERPGNVTSEATARL